MKTALGRRIDLSQRFKSRALPYKQMGYWNADYAPRGSDMLAVFRITPQDGVDPEEAAAVAGESSTTTWTVVWTDRVTDHGHYQAKAYRLDPVPDIPGQYSASIAYDLDRFEGGSIANLTASIIGERVRIHAAQGAAVGGHAHPASLAQDLQAPATGIIVERERPHRDLRIRERARDFAINASNRRFWQPPVRRYIDECIGRRPPRRRLQYAMDGLARCRGPSHARPRRRFPLSPRQQRSQESRRVAARLRGKSDGDARRAGGW